MEISAAEFAVGDAPQADIFLGAHDFDNAVILDRPQRLGFELAGEEGFARRDQPLRAQIAADVIGAEGRSVDQWFPP